VFYETPLAEAQVNVVLRMLERFGRVVEPHEIASLARTDPASLAPHALSRMTRDLERPAPDEGFAAIEVVPFVRDMRGGRGGVLVALDALGSLDDETRVTAELRRLLSAGPAGGPCLLYAWRPDADGEVATEPWTRVVRAATSAGAELAEVALCTHPAGPPICWCRPPLPALFLAFAHRHALDLGASVLFGKSPTDRKVAAVLGVSFVEIA
jgi:hypothetical protein